MLFYSNVVGTIYPVYSSYKAIESLDNNQGEATQWLTYWTIYGALGLIEGTSDKVLSWFPYYYHGKLAFLLWLQMPQSMGARMLYREYMKPVLRKYQPKVDTIIDIWHAHFGWIIEARKAELQALGHSLKVALASLFSFTKWFLDTNQDSNEHGGQLPEGNGDQSPSSPEDVE